MIRSVGRPFYAFLAAFVVLGVSACSSETPETPTEAPPPTADTVEDAAEMPGETDGDAMQERAEEVADAASPAAAGAVEASGDDGDPCTLTILAGDSLAYSTNELSVPSSCAEVTVTLTHSGQLPAAAMGHNWVLLPEDAVASVATAGMNAGLDANYLPAGDDRIVAATRIVGGGESDSVTFSLGALEAGIEYVYVCTFPGHWSVMRGAFTVTD